MKNGPVGLETKKLGGGRQARRWGWSNGGLGSWQRLRRPGQIRAGAPMVFVEKC